MVRVGGVVGASGGAALPQQKRNNENERLGPLELLLAAARRHNRFLGVGLTTFEPLTVDGVIPWIEWSAKI